MEENTPITQVTRAKVVNYRHLAGMDKEKGCKSVKSGKSRKSKKSTGTNKVEKSGKKKNKTSGEDSREGDFSLGDEISLRSDASRVYAIEDEMDVNVPTLAEKYNEHKVQLGLQE